MLVNWTLPLAAVEISSRPKPLTVTPEFTCPIRFALKDWMRSLVAAGLVELVVFVVTVLAAQATVTVAGATPVVAHAASARLGIDHAAAAVVDNSRTERGIRT